MCLCFLAPLSSVLSENYVTCMIVKHVWGFMEVLIFAFVRKPPALPWPCSTYTKNPSYLICGLYVVYCSATFWVFKNISIHGERLSLSVNSWLLLCVCYSLKRQASKIYFQKCDDKVEVDSIAFKSRSASYLVEYCDNRRTLMER